MKSAETAFDLDCTDVCRAWNRNTLFWKGNTGNVKPQCVSSDGGANFGFGTRWNKKIALLWKPVILGYLHPGNKP